MNVKRRQLSHGMPQFTRLTNGTELAMISLNVSILEVLRCD